METRNHETVQLDIEAPGISFHGPAALRNGVITFRFTGDTKTKKSIAALLDAVLVSLRIWPIEGYGRSTNPYLQATVLEDG